MINYSRIVVLDAVVNFWEKPSFFRKRRNALVLIYEKRKGIAYLTLNRPEARNAVDPELAVELAAAWEDYREDKDLRCAIVTGSGDKAFCAGADLPFTFPGSCPTPGPWKCC
jgi:1,4-dihydroxy-2-naphthoyl-CoA synthase